jgi:hypothetical protein
MCVIATLLLVTGCNRAESPAEVREDVAEAQRDGTEQVAEAREDLARDRADTGEVFNESSAENRYELQVAKADADRKVALEQCETLSGSAQEACKELAEEKYELRKAEAERDRERM